MTSCQRAVQVWPILVLCACRRETLTYDLLGKLIGVPTEGLGKVLEPIQSYCILECLEPLTALVVNKATGLPGDGFIGAANVPCARAEVYARDWLLIAPPSAESLLHAGDGMVVRQARQAEEARRRRLRAAGTSAKRQARR